MLNSEDFKKTLYNKGAVLVGFANLASIVDTDINYGISIAINIPVQVIKSIVDIDRDEFFNPNNCRNKALTIPI